MDRDDETTQDASGGEYVAPPTNTLVNDANQPKPGADGSNEISSNNQNDPPSFRGVVVDRWIELAFTFAIMVATIVNVCVAVRQWDVANGQLAVMRADQRPWISLDIEPEGPLIRDGNDWSFIVKYTINNVGKSPAFDVDFLAVMISLAAPQSIAPPPQGFSYGPPTKAVDTAVETACEEQQMFGNPGSIFFPSAPQTNRWKAHGGNPRVGFIPGFSIVGCVTYRFTNEPIRHRTVRIFDLEMRAYGQMIDLSATTIPIESLTFFPHYPTGSRAN